MLTMRELSMSRKSASILSFSSGAKICMKLAQPIRLPTPKERPVRNSNPVQQPQPLRAVHRLRRHAEALEVVEDVGFDAL